MFSLLTTTTTTPVDTAPFQTVFDFIKAGGPLALAILSGAWAVKKDRDLQKAQDKAALAAKAAYDQIVTLVTTQTAAMVKTESAVTALKDVIAVLERRLQ